MPIDLIPESDLRKALRPHRVNLQNFEFAVRERVQSLQAQAASDPWVHLSRFARAAAAFLPLEVLAGCQVSGTATKAAPTGFYKLLSYVTFPAISLFVLLGATVFSFFKIRSIQQQSPAELDDQQAIREAIQLWWRQNRVGVILVFGVSLLLMLLGATWLLFAFYLISLGLLVFVLSSFAKVGIGNRDVVGRTCGLALMFSATGTLRMGSQEIHFLDQSLISVVFFTGVLLLVPFMTGRSAVAGAFSSPKPVPRWYWIFYAAILLFELVGIPWIWPSASIWRPFRLSTFAILAIGGLAPVLHLLLHRWKLSREHLNVVRLLPAILMIVLLVPLIAWNARSLLWPATPERIKNYVESFDRAPFSSASWANWEIAARWAIDSQLQPDFSKPSRLLAAELSGEQNPYILSSALRVGLLAPDQFGQLKDYDARRKFTFLRTRVSQSLTAPTGQLDWVVRTAVQKNDLSPAERDQLEVYLLAVFEDMSSDPHITLEKADHATQLLAAIGRPVDVDKYRTQIHELLRTFHHTSGGWSRVNGGFRSYRNIAAGDVKATAHAVKLMEVFGAPDDLNLLWVRSFLSNSRNSVGDQKWIAAATLERFNKLPTSPHPTWFDYLYYERALLVAIALVGLCLYATYTSPIRKAQLPANQTCPA